MAFELNRVNLHDLARGAAILGTGGGGDPLVGRMLVEQALDEGLHVEIIDTDEIGDTSLVAATAMMGAPSVVVEKLPSGYEAVSSLRVLEEHLGRSVDATMPMECGGLNSMIPLVVAARAGIPIIDADGMGRAFPELQMETFGVYGINGSPLVVSDEWGHSTLIDTGDDNARMETFARAITIKMGGAAYIAEYSMSGADVRRTAIPGTLSLGRRLGEAVRVARVEHRDPFGALIDAVEDSIYGFARILASGKVVDVERNVIEGFTTGTVKIAEFGTQETIVIEFRNENVVARRNGEVIAIVPDLITIMDFETAVTITTEALRYGQRVRVVAIATPDIMRTPEALEVWGPHAFGLAEDWRPVEEIHA